AIPVYIYNYTLTSIIQNKHTIFTHSSNIWIHRLKPFSVKSRVPTAFPLSNRSKTGWSISTGPEAETIEKKDLFTGTYMPSTKLTGGYRVLSYLDPSEPRHAQLKNLLFFMLKNASNRVIPQFQTTYTELFQSLETELDKNGKAAFNDVGEQAAFRFLGRAYFNSNPEETKLGTSAPTLISSWVLFNLGPSLDLGLPWFLQELLLHTFRLPSFLIKSSYNKLYDYFESVATMVIEQAEKLGVPKDEAVHNILFAILFPNTLKWIGLAGENLHTQLAEEIRGAIKSYGGGKVTLEAIEQMPLTKSVVYESLRIEPPVPPQYGKAKSNFTIQSHDATFQVKEGEMLFGYQPFATKDPKVFDRPEEFVPDRFVGDGEALLKYVWWSNGPETESPTVENKQCAGKNFVVLITRLFVIELFRRYDSFEIELGESPLGAANKEIKRDGHLGRGVVSQDQRGYYNNRTSKELANNHKTSNSEIKVYNVVASLHCDKIKDCTSLEYLQEIQIWSTDFVPTSHIGQADESLLSIIRRRFMTENTSSLLPTASFHLSFSVNKELKRDGHLGRGVGWSGSKIKGYNGKIKDRTSLAYLQEIEIWSADFVPTSHIGQQMNRYLLPDWLMPHECLTGLHFKFHPSTPRDIIIDSDSTTYFFLHFSLFIESSSFIQIRTPFSHIHIHNIFSNSNMDSSSEAPLREIPGSYGIPFIQPFKDRLEYFYGTGGPDGFFQSRAQKYQSTVFRSNMPPGPFISSNPKVIVLLDAKSFPILFDVSRVEKKDLFTGTYMPSTKLTGGYRVLSYLDPSEPRHAQLKNLLFFMLKNSSNRVIPQFQTTYTELFEGLEAELAKNGKAAFNDVGEQAAFRFLGRVYFESNPEETKLGTSAPSLITTWVLFNLSPLGTAGLPWFLEDPLLHTFRLPSFLVKSNYNKLYDYFESVATPLVEQAEILGVPKEEALHNILFAVCFNTFGGMKILFPNTLKWIALAGVNLHTQLAEEIRGAIKSYGDGKVTLDAMERMPLMKSVVYESLRIEPPVPPQYGKAKSDFTIESHDATFEIKKGEMLFGYQPFATKDPKVFDRPEEFVPDRFVGDGEALLKYVFWSNGPETESPTVGNKQCAGKNFVVLITRLFVVELFRGYDTFEVELGAISALGAGITFTSLKKANT
ncbi:hypothetical protein M8C21_020927, partial [Ambrosia artemisiifolia]